MMRDRIVILGTGTCQILPHRLSSSVLIELTHLRLLYDIGPGILGRLCESGLKQDDICHIILSHFHPDHVTDLIPLLQASCWSKTDPRSKDLHIYGPKGLKEFFAKMLDLFSPGTFQCDRFTIHIHECEQDTIYIEGMSFDWVSLPHAGNHGLRWIKNEKIYALTGDTYDVEKVIRFLRDAEIAVVDAGHMGEKDIITIAKHACPKRLVCTHLYEELDEEKLNREAANIGYDGTIIVGQDLMSFDLY